MTWKAEDDLKAAGATVAQTTISNELHFYHLIFGERRVTHIIPIVIWGWFSANTTGVLQAIIEIMNGVMYQNILEGN